MPKLNKKYIFFLGLIAIVIVYSLYNIYFDLTYVPGIPGKWKHVNKLAFVLIVYGIGTIALRKYTVDWMMQIWHLVHIVFISILVLIGFYDWYHGSITEQVRNIANTLHEFLISPVLYVSMGIIQSRLIKYGKAE
jgi:hypothetical protein